MTTPYRHIREAVFREPVAAKFARDIGVSGAQLSRLEAGGRPSFDLMERTRRLAADRGIAWEDKYFFEAPPAIAESDEAGR